MLKKILRRCLFGAPTGLTVFMGIMLTAAHLRGDGELRTGYYLLQIYGTELNAMTAACISAMVIGMIWSAASLIYETDWNLLIQTLAHAVACVVPSLLIARAMYWMPRNWEGIVQYVVIFGVIYAVIWVFQYLGIKRRVTQMNEKLNEGTME